MNISTIKEKLQALELGQHEETLLRLVRNSITFKLRMEEEAKIRIGQSKVGGRPDFPKGKEWIEEANEPKRAFSFLMESSPKYLPFIAQINLSELVHYDTETLLPKEGMLYFFFEPNKRKSKVIYYRGSSEKFKRLNFPEELWEGFRFDATTLSFSSQLDFPDNKAHALSFLSEEEKEKIATFRVEHTRNKNKLLGYANAIQGDMAIQCELTRTGLSYQNLKEMTQEDYEAWMKNADKWKLLLQLEGYEANMDWGDSGMIYFWIREEDLVQRNFDAVRCVLQSS